jgi:hypothetical protein
MSEPVRPAVGVFWKRARITINQALMKMRGNTHKFVSIGGMSDS